LDERASFAAQRGKDKVKVKTQFKMVAGGATGYKIMGIFSVETLPDEPYVLLRIEGDEPVVRCLEYTPGPAYPCTKDFSTRAKAEAFVEKLVAACRKLKQDWESVEIPASREIEI
jgi:hypothetical protein